MSLILDALRKSDRQRSRRATEQLRWGPGPASHPGHHPRPGIIMLLVTIIAMTVAASAWLGSHLTTTPVAEQPQGRSTGETGQPQRPAIRDLKDELATRPAEPAASVPATDDLTTSANSRQPDSPAGNETQDFDDILAAPGLSEMPADYRIRVPQLEINVHAWTEEPSARFVLINMRRYAEGERLQEGPLLRQITPEGVVLEFENELFTLPQR